MIEPVAYLNNYKDKSTNITRFKPIDNTALVSSNKLYTEDQLHPRVKMTKKQYDRLMYDKLRTNLSTCLGYFIDHDGNNKFGLLSENLMGDLTQEDIARAWLNPEETIEIIPTMKWFVRSKEEYQPDMDQGISESGYLYLTQGDTYSVEYHEMTSFKDEATQFSTEAEAKLWTTPDTEAVQLPVEDE